MAADFRKNANAPEPTSIKGQIIEQVQSYEYLGTIIDSALNFQEDYEAVCSDTSVCHICESCPVSV